MLLEFSGSADAMEERGSAAASAAATFSPGSGSLGAFETSAMLRLTPGIAHVEYTEEVVRLKRNEIIKHGKFRRFTWG